MASPDAAGPAGVGERSSLVARLASPALVGGLCILAGLLLNEVFVGRVLAVDEQIEADRARRLLLGLESAAVVVGLALLGTPLGRRLPAALRALATVLLLGLNAFGLWSAARWLEWIPEPVRGLEELQAWQRSPDARTFGTARIGQLEAELAALDAAARPEHGVHLERLLADQLLRHGRIDDALASLERAAQLAARPGLPAELLRQVTKDQGIAHMRRGEAAHCLAMHDPESCLLPLSGGGLWNDPDPARAAIERFERVLAEDPDDRGARWLLNIAYQALGAWPDEVPEAWVIPPAAFASEAECEPWPDVAGECGVAVMGLLGGAIVDDFDGDGLLDVIASDYDTDTVVSYLANRGDGSFEDRTEAAGLGDQVGGFNLLQADYDNDGRLDFAIVRGAWGRAWGRQRNSLLRNEGERFRDVADELGLARTALPTLAAAWGDYDADGWVDLFVGNGRLTRYRIAPCELFQNDAGLELTDRAGSLGVENGGETTAVNWGDFDNDGDLDLYVSNVRGPNRLYENRDGERFVDVADELGVAESPPTNNTFAAWFWDYDNDGWLDLFVGDYGTRELGDYAAEVLGGRAGEERIQLFENRGGEVFADVALERGLSRVSVAMGANHGDVDNDGFPDCYLGTGRPPFGYLVPNRLFLNHEGRRFVDVTSAANVGQIQKGHAVAFGDLDNDGDQDLYAEVGGWYPADVYPNALFLNPGTPQRWITVRLEGTRSNRSAIGARLAFEIEEPGGRRTIHASVGPGGSFGASSLQAEVGLGRARRVVALEVRWPSGVTQRFRDLPLERFVVISEGSDLVRTEERPRVDLGGGG